MVHIIGICGCIGSGKSSFCRSMVEDLESDGFRVCFIKLSRQVCQNIILTHHLHLISTP